MVVSAFALGISLTGAGCARQVIATTCKYQTKEVTFGAVSEYALPNSSRDPNGITTGADGSVWFGNQALGGVDNLFPNGTLVEYSWPGYPGDGRLNATYPKALIWNLQVWDGRVWAADNGGTLVNGLDPDNDSVVELNVTAAPHPATSAPALAPYILTATPYGDMWFTALPFLTGGELPVVGTISSDLSVTLYAVSGLGHEEPIQIQFYNSTLAYLVALDPSDPTDSGLYSFDPVTNNSTIYATRVGGNFSMIYPDSLTIVGDTVWITQHATSAVVSYDLGTGVWTTYPTSNVGFTYATYPYFIQSYGGIVWFNEHYANEIAMINASAGTMTEYSEADPPIVNSDYIQQDLTVASSPQGLWFTSWDGNYIGLVSVSQSPSFSISASDGNQTSLSPGMSATVNFTLSGKWADSLQVLSSDSEDFNSTPNRIAILPSQTTFAPGSGPRSLSVVVDVEDALPQGKYTVDVTVSDGLVRQTAFLVVNVT